MSNRIVATRTMATRLIWALCAAFILTSAPALADNDRREHRRGDSHWNGHDGKHHNKHHDKHYRQARKKYDGRHKHGRSVVIWQGHRHWAPSPRRHFHYHRPKPVQRHHHHHHFRRSGGDDWALYAILALQLVDTLNDSQQQSYAWAQQRAVAVPLGERIEWQDSGVYGAVTPIRDGNDGGGRYCREFQHQITVGGRLQSGYGVACRQPDGAWEIVS